MAGAKQPLWVACLLLCCCRAGAAQKSDIQSPCKRSVLGTAGVIYRVVPSSSSVSIEGVDGTIRTAVADDCLSGGETLRVPKETERVVIYDGVDLIAVERLGSYKAKRGLAGTTRAAMDYLGRFLDAVQRNGIPSRQPDAIRGIGFSPAARTRQTFRMVGSLHVPAVQRVIAGSTLTVGWQGGRAPWHCLLYGEDNAAASKLDVSKPQCDIKVDTKVPARLEVGESGSDNVLAWRLTTASDHDVPRPPWLFETKETAGDADRTAWAVWLWKSGDPAWRLQSLSMLQSARSTVWFAGYFLDSVLLDRGVELIRPEGGSE